MAAQNGVAIKENQMQTMDEKDYAIKFELAFARKAALIDIEDLLYFNLSADKMREVIAKALETCNAAEKETIRKFR